MKNKIEEMNKKLEVIESLFEMVCKDIDNEMDKDIRSSFENWCLNFKERL